MLKFAKPPQQYFDQSSFYGNFSDDIRACEHELLVESAFLTTKRVNRMLPLFIALIRQGVNVTVNTRYPEEHEGAMRLQAFTSIDLLQRANIKVLYTAGLHRKLAIIDRSIVWQGSLNILSQADSCELMLRTDSKMAAENLLNFIGLKEFLKIG